MAIESTAQTGATQPPGTFLPGQAQINKRERFLKACRCEPLDYPPVWLMRQAGRALPEYRELKLKYSFLQLVQTPELAMEVTLQPTRRFGFDAAILFSDILVVCEGMGQPYRFREQGGIEMDFLLTGPADIDRLQVEPICERLEYTAKALRLIKGELGDKTALIGFAGSPWTLANFMLEGGGVREYSKAKHLFYTQPRIFRQLMEKLTAAISSYLELQIKAGADVVQIFDSMGGLVSAAAFDEASGRWMKQIIANLSGAAPAIVFSKDTHGNWDHLAGTGANVVGLDWTVGAREVADLLPREVAVQGNLDPYLLTTTPEIVAVETQRILDEMSGRPGHIFNLGHGVTPAAKLENIESLVNTIRTRA